jgi:uncharacterized membrane protein (DUF373 family)
LNESHFPSPSKKAGQKSDPELIAAGPIEMADQVSEKSQEPESRRRGSKRPGALRSLIQYGSFEQVVSLVLMFVISGVIIAAVCHLVIEVTQDLVIHLVAPLDVVISQDIFGMVMTVLIALEFNHTILTILHRKESVVQVRIVILIAILALARKFIILDIKTVEPLVVIGLAISVMALGCAYWLVREQDRRTEEVSPTTGE